MSWDELHTRASQEFAKRWDAVVFTRRRRPVDHNIENSGNFFFSAEQLDVIVAGLRQRMPDYIEATIAQAERICRHEFDLLGYEGLRYGPEIDWHKDAVSGKSAPRKPWFKIDFLNYSELGDVKVTWELNRHQHLVALAKAYCFSGNDGYVVELIRQWYSWQESNPYPIGVNWASNLEVALRSLSWLWIFHLLRICPLVTSRFKADIRCGLALSGRHIEKYLSTYFSPNTHLLGEGVALYFLGVLCNTDSSSRWKRLGWNIVLAQAERQVRPDGMHFEQSMYYHVYALDLFLHARILAALNGILISEEFDRMLKRMLQVLCLMGQGATPIRFGDDDGGRLFDPRRNRAEHLLDPLSTGAVLFGDTSFKGVKPDLIEETIWLLGLESVQRFDAISGSLPQLESNALLSSGSFIMMSPGPPRTQALIDAGPHGAIGGGHGHADALSIQLTVERKEVLVDAGSFVYASGGSERQIFRGTASHNTVQIDGVDQALSAGPFPWRRLPEVRVDKWVQGNSFDLLVAKHDGYARLPDPVVHQRSTLGLKSQFWFVLDEVRGEGSHSVDVFWHLAPGLRWELRNNFAIANWTGGGLALLFAETQSWSPRIEESWYSPVYGSRTTNQLLVVNHQGKLPKTLATVLLPFDDSTSDLGRFTQIDEDLSREYLRAYRYDRCEESHFFFSSLHDQWKWRELKSDAGFLYCSISERGVERLIFCGGSYIDVAGKRVISSSRMLSRLEWSSQHSPIVMSCSDVDAIRSTAWEHLSALDQWITKVIAV